jgi:hypothetical protein
MSAESRNNLIKEIASTARLRHGKYATALLRMQAVARQWLSGDHVVTPTDTNATIEEGVFYAFHAGAIKRGRAGKPEDSQSKFAVAKAGDSSGTQRKGTSAVGSRYKAAQ